MLVLQRPVEITIDSGPATKMTERRLAVEIAAISRPSLAAFERPLWAVISTDQCNTSTLDT
jgi:hypothetical protein